MEQTESTFVKSSELDYAQYEAIHPKYTYIQILPQGNTTFTGTASGGTQIIFELPAQSVYNLSKSYLTYHFQVPSVVATSHFVVVDTWTHFNQIFFSNRGSQYLAQIRELPNYLELVWNAETKFSDFISFDNYGNSYGTG